MSKGNDEVRVALIAANPIDTTRLQLDKEVGEIKRKIRSAASGRVKLESVEAARPEDLIEALHRIKPHVLHFSGHGLPDGGIQFRGDGDDATTVTPMAMAQLLRAVVGAGDPIQAVLLNACYSLEMATPLAEEVGLAIGMSRAVTDDAAIAFAATFYEALAHGRVYRDAFNFACARLALDESIDATNPEIVVRESGGTDVKSVVEVPTPMPVAGPSPAEAPGVGGSRAGAARVADVRASASEEEEWRRFVPAPPKLEGGKEWHVFLSYRSADRRWTIALYDHLRSLGYRVFLDQTAIAAGEPLFAKLQAALGSSQAGVLVWSRHTADSEWVQREYAAMEQLTSKGFHFVPITIDGDEPPILVTNRIFLDFSEFADGPAGGNLLRLLHGIGGETLSAEAAGFVNRLDEQAKSVRADIEACAKTGDADELVALAASEGTLWTMSPTLGCLVAEKLSGLGNQHESLALLERLTERFPHAIRPRQLMGLTLKRLDDAGAGLKKAIRILEKLVVEGETDPETLGILASAWAGLYELQPERPRSHLLRSRELYLTAFREHPGDSYTGINAAAKSLFLGEEPMARELAEKVQGIVGEVVSMGQDYWTAATVPEAHLILRQFSAAAEGFRKAIAVDATARTNHGRTREQAENILDALSASSEDRELVLEAFGGA